MSHQQSARLWKLATLGLSLVCLALIGALAFQMASTVAPTSAAGTVSPARDAPVSLREFAGPDALMAKARAALKARFSEAGKLTYKSPGVEAIAVDTTIVDGTGPAEGGDTNIAISVKLLVTKQPGNAMLAAISATGAVSVSKDTTPETVQATKEQALAAAAGSTFDDLLLTLKRGEAAE